MLRRLARKTALAILKPINLRLIPLHPELRGATNVPDAPEIPERMLADCRVLPSREHSLNHLPKGGTVAEIGVAYGDFSEAILAINKPRKLVLVDAWDGTRYGPGLARVSERFASQINAGTLQIELGMSVEAMKRLVLQSFDWIYIDTSHDYATTSAELDIASGLIVPGGYIAGHDFCVGNPAMGFSYGVIPAVCEFCIERNFALAYITLAGNGYFSFCLSASRTPEMQNHQD